MSYTLDRADLADLARGAALLGTGGGGDPYIGRLLVDQALKETGRTITVLDPAELDDDAFVIPTAQMGAPTVMVEKIPRGDEAVIALRALERHLGRRADATMPIECGGINSMIPLLVAAHTGLPVVDADGMGRAFPELQMETFSVYGVPGSPLAIGGENDEMVIIDTGHDNKRMEWLARGITIRMGGVAHIAEYSMTGAEVKRTAVPNTLTPRPAHRPRRCAGPGRARDPIAALAATLADTLYNKVRVLFRGKVVDVERRPRPGSPAATPRFAAFDGDGGARADLPERAPGRPGGRRGPLHRARPDLRARRRHRRADHHRGPAVRPAGRGGRHQHPGPDAQPRGARGVRAPRLRPRRGVPPGRGAGARVKAPACHPGKIPGRDGRPVTVRP